MIDFEAKVPDAHELGLESLMDGELRELLSRIHAGVAGPAGVLVKHFNDLQASGPEPTKKYARWKKKKYGTTRKFEKTGAARRAMASNTKPRNVRISTKHRRISITLLRKSGGVNVYNVVQRGRFRGLKVTTTGFLGRKKTVIKSKAQVHAEQLSRGAAYRAAKARGFKGTFTEFHSGGGKKDEIERISGKAMPITAVMPGDEKICSPVIAREVERMLRERGLPLE